MKVFLASRSPRRKELLKELIPEFEVAPSDADEDYIAATPEETVIEIARRKALAATCPADSVVIASDTLVYLDGKYLGKPVSKEEAKRMLTSLSGKTHIVASGVAVKVKDKIYTASEISEVTFKSLSESDIEDYISRFDVMDKAGSYAIQDGVTVSSYMGEYSNIVGLPVKALREILKEIGII